MATPHQELFAALARLRAAWPQRGWSYDNRFQCVASSFSADQATTARTLVTTLFPYIWTSRTLATAPAMFAQIAERTGGVRSAQQLLGADPVGRLVPYGLWWPWEEGTTISLRIGLDNASMAETIEFSGVFGAEL
jgi:hypothetical protein